MPRTPPSSPRGDRRRSELLRAAVECLIDEGWAGLTHRRIGQRAGANPALLQYYFGNLAGLREQVAHLASAELTTPLGELAMSAATTEELVGACVRELGETASQPAQVRLLVQIMVGTAYYPEVAGVVRAELAAAKSVMAQHLSRLDPDRSDAAAAAAADLFFAAVDGLMLHTLAAADEGAAIDISQVESLLWAIMAPDAPGSHQR